MTRTSNTTAWRKAVAALTLTAFGYACTEVDGGYRAPDPGHHGQPSQNAPSGGITTWNVDTGEFFFDGVLLGTVSCSDYDDPRIDGTDAEKAAFLDEKCTTTMAPEAPMPPDPCDPANMTFAIDAGGYTIDKCEQVDGTDAYWGFVADWHPVPVWSDSFDAECWVDQATGDGCCAFYVDVDPAELSACDVVYTPEFGYGGGTYGGGTYGGDTYGSARMAPTAGPATAHAPTIAVAAAAADDPPGNPNPAPPPAPRPGRSTIMNWIGGALFVIGGIITPFAPQAGKPIQDLGARIIRQIRSARELQGRIRRQAPRGGGIGAPPDPPPGVDREPFERGGRRPPPDTIPPRPPRVLPPGGRPIPKPGQVAPQPGVRPPYRPR